MEQHELAKLRASDSDRQRIADVLTNAYADGRLTVEEHSERLDLVWEAKTLGELEPLIVDLGRPEMAQQQPTQQPNQSWSTALPMLADIDAATGDRSWAVMASNTREGEWLVQPRQSVFTLMGSAEWDLRDAIFTSMTVEINISAIMGSVELWLPEGVALIDQTTHFLGSSEIKGLGTPDPNAPTVIVKGFTCMGSLEVYGPNHKTLKQRLGFSKDKRR